MPLNEVLCIMGKKNPRNILFQGPVVLAWLAKALISYQKPVTGYSVLWLTTTGIMPGIRGWVCRKSLVLL